jgi:hypothetical protein
VLEAVTTALQQAGRPLRVRDIHAAAEELLFGPIPFSSVNEALSTHAGHDQRFRRLRYGVYEHRFVANADRAHTKRRGPRQPDGEGVGMKR